MHSSTVNPFCGCITVLVIIFCILCTIRSLYPMNNDYYIVCNGYPCNTVVSYSHSPHHKGWYITYSMNFTVLLNPDLCHRYEHVKYRTKKFDQESQALNTSRSMVNTVQFKTYPTETCGILNILSFLIGFVLLFALLLSCSNTYQMPIEKQQLLPYTNRK